MRARTWLPLVAATALCASLTACSSASSTLSPADNIVIDCTAASTAIGDYGTALQGLVTALKNGDSSAASSAADAFSTAAKKVTDSLPGLPQDAQSFLGVSQDFAERVKDVASGNGDLPALTAEAQTTFGSTDFTQGADAVEAFYRQQCPAEAATQS